MAMPSPLPPMRGAAPRHSVPPSTVPGLLEARALAASSSLQGGSLRPARKTLRARTTTPTSGLAPLERSPGALELPGIVGQAPVGGGAPRTPSKPARGSPRTPSKLSKSAAEAAEACAEPPEAGAEPVSAKSAPPSVQRRSESTPALSPTSSPPSGGQKVAGDKSKLSPLRSSMSSRSVAQSAPRGSWAPGSAADTSKLLSRTPSKDSQAGFRESRPSLFEDNRSSWSGLQTSPSEKSQKLLEGLKDLRITAINNIETVDTNLSATASVVNDLSDSEAGLRQMERELLQRQSNLAADGASRHASVLVASRTLQCAHRKAELIKEVQKGLHDFETEFADRDNMLLLVKAGDVHVPPVLEGALKFVASYVHGPEEKPSEAAAKCDFEDFVKTFKLPGKHHLLESYRKQIFDAGEWWVETLIKEDACGQTEHPALKRIYDAARAAGLPDDHPKVVTAGRLLKKCFAKWVLTEAQKELEVDDENEKKDPDMSGGIQVYGAATDAAARIDEKFKEAIEQRIPEDDPQMKEASNIMQELRQRDGKRKRLAARARRSVTNSPT